MVRIQNGNSNNYLEFRARADAGNYYGMLFTDNNVGGYISFRNYTADGVAAGSDCMIYGSFQDHIFQNGYDKISGIKLSPEEGLPFSMVFSNLQI